MEHKAFPITEIKAPQDGQPGEFQALVSVFGNVDRGGDRLERGAFQRTLAERGLPPIIWSHEWGTPPIGVTTSAQETDEGLVLSGRLFVGEDEDHAVARQVYAAMRAADGNGQSPLREFSFGYQAKEFSYEEQDDGTRVRVLTDVDLFEAGPTLVGMNPDTRLLSIKNASAAAVPGATLTISYQDGAGDGADRSDGTAEDKPGPNPAPAAGEEGQARIGRLLAEQPQHHIQGETP